MLTIITPASLNYTNNTTILPHAIITHDSLFFLHYTEILQIVIFQYTVLNYYSQLVNEKKIAKMNTLYRMNYFVVFQYSFPDQFYKLIKNIFYTQFHIMSETKIQTRRNYNLFNNKF